MACLNRAKERGTCDAVKSRRKTDRIAAWRRRYKGVHNSAEMSTILALLWPFFPGLKSAVWPTSNFKFEKDGQNVHFSRQPRSMRNGRYIMQKYGCKMLMSLSKTAAPQLLQLLLPPPQRAMLPQTLRAPPAESPTRVTVRSRATGTRWACFLGVACSVWYES